MRVGFETQDMEASHEGQKGGGLWTLSTVAGSRLTWAVPETLTLGSTLLGVSGKNGKGIR